MEKIKVSEEQYSYILFEQIKISCVCFYELCKEINITNDLVNYLTYYQYILYISENVLLTKYAEEKLNLYIDLVWEHMFSYIKDNKIIEDEEMIDETKCVFKKSYNDLKNKKIKVNNDDSLHKLVENFLNEIECDNDGITHYNVFLAFSSFIIHHTNDLLNESIVVQ